MSPEDRFLRELENLRRESDAAAQFLYSWIALHQFAGKNKKVEQALQRHALFWNTHLGALQTSLFIALGRIFDNDARNHTINRLLREAKDNRQIFSRASFAARLRKRSPGAPWIAARAKEAHIPTDKDFKRLTEFVMRRRAIYKKAYEGIRHTIFAHSGVGSRQKKDALFSKTQVGELQRLVLSLRGFHETMWQLFHNGREPILRPPKYSTRLMKEDISNMPFNAPVEQRIFALTCGVLGQYAAGAQQLVQADK